MPATRRKQVVIGLGLMGRPLILLLGDCVAVLLVLVLFFCLLKSLHIFRATISFDKYSVVLVVCTSLYNFRLHIADKNVVNLA